MKIVFSEGKNSFQKDYEGKSLLGKKIGEEFEGGLIGLDGYKLKITGGSTKEGFRKARRSRRPLQETSFPK